MDSQQILFLIRDENYISNQKFLQQMRLCVYDLRENSFQNDQKNSIAFCLLNPASKDESSQSIQFSDIETFSFSKNFPSSVQNISTDTLNKYLEDYSSNQNPSDTGPKFIIFQKITGEFSLLNQNEKLGSLYKKTGAQELLVQSYQINECESEIKKFINKKGKTAQKAKTKVSGTAIALLLVALAVVALISSLPFVITKVTEPETVYLKVYTGDGDRLIMREEPSKEAGEIMRLIEGEAVILLEEGPEWNKVNYHGLTGYCHKEYLVDAVEEEYEITNADAKYYYGKACCKFLEPEMVDGYKWIKEAALTGLIRAQWTLVGFYDKGTSHFSADKYEARYWCNIIDSNSNSLEERDELVSWKKLQSQYEASGNKEMAVKYTNKIKERERDIKIIRQQCARYLSEYYFKESNIDDASDYYGKALELGLKGDSDYMVQLADASDDWDTSFYWISKAAKLNNPVALEYMADYYYEQEEYYSAISYYKKAYEYNNNIDIAYSIGLIYFNNLKDYTSSFSWFYKVYSAGKYDHHYYQSCYALGYCYEMGYGTYYSINKAMQFYGYAYSSVDYAKEAYDRLYKKYGDYSWY